VKTTWKHRKKAAKRQKVLTIGLAVLIFLGGIVVGNWWGSERSIDKQLTYDLEKTKYDLAMAKYELDRTRVDLDTTRLEWEKISKVSDIRKNIEAIFLKIFDVHREHSKLVEAAEKNSSKEKRNKTKRELEVMWKQEFSPLKDRLAQLENTLSELENREPRDFDFRSLGP
jgi:hypothetical protein